MKLNQFFYILLFLIGLTFVSPLIQGSLKSEESFGQWQILDWNDEKAVDWDWGVSSFVMSNGSYVNYTLSHHEPSNFTHPSAGTINIGNLTTQTTNNKTAEVLVLSIYGWFPGLITSSNNWSLQEQVAFSATQGEWTLGSLTVEEMSYNYQGYNRKAITFNYKQDPSIGNQNTTLTYDKETGFLLEGWTEIFFQESYVLHLVLAETNIVDIKSSNLTVFFPVTIIPALILLRKKKKKELFLNPKYL
ncbi:MAG: hypothetical protein ACW98W_17260 [Candidatus Hodarchaeales archaeon]|jgi:hypothetical protein